MAYLETTASDFRDLLGQVRDFAVLDGWTAEYDAVVASGRLGLEKGAAKIAFQENTAVRTNEITSGTLDDDGFYANCVLDWVAAKTTHWEHDTGGLVTAFGDLDAVYCNDLTGPFPNVWMFSDASGNHIHVVAQQGSGRFTHFGFGLMEVNGLDQPACPYVHGTFWVFWPDNDDYSSSSNAVFNTPEPRGFSEDHIVGLFAERYSSRCNVSVMLPTGLLNAAYGFPATAFIIPSGYINPLLERMDTYEGSISGNFGIDGLPLDYIWTYNNDVTTGGVALSHMPVFYRASNSLTAIRAYLGDFPETRLVNIDNLSPAQEIEYASDTWMVFPLKQKGLYEDSNWGTNPQPVVNSLRYGLAYKKVV